jgi:predicted transcriptional regulator
MESLKQNVEQMIRNLPDDSTAEDIQYQIYVLDKIQKGQQDIRDGKGISHEEAKARLSKWITNQGT